MLKVFGPVCLAITMLAQVSPIAAQAIGDEIAQHVPANTPLVVEILRPEVISLLLEGWKLQDLALSVPAVKTAIENKDLANARMALEAVAATLKTTPLNLIDDLAGTGATLAVEGPNRFLLILKPKQPDRLQPAIDALLKLVRQELTKNNQPDPISTIEYQGVPVTSFGPQGALAILDGRMMIASTLDQIKNWIENRNGLPIDSSLATDTGFTRFRSSVSDQAAVWFYVRLDRARALNKNSDTQAPPKPGDESGGRLLLGRWVDVLSKSKALAGELVIERDQISLNAVMTVPEEVQSGPLDVFRPQTSSAQVPMVLPGGLVSATLWRDLAAVWEVREQFLDPETLKGLAQLDSFAGQFFGGRDFGTGVLGALGDQWNLVIAQQDYDAQKPMPTTRYPGAALLIPVDPEDEEFGVRLQSAFQTFIGLANIGAAQSKSPPLILGSEEVEGVMLFRGKFLAPKQPQNDEPVDDRYNFSPSAALVGHTFVLASSTDVARSVIQTLRNQEPISEVLNVPPPGFQATLQVRASGAEVARLVNLNREVLISRNLLEKGNSREVAAGEVDLIESLLKRIQHARADVFESQDSVRLNLQFDRAKTVTKP